MFTVENHDPFLQRKIREKKGYNLKTKPRKEKRRKKRKEKKIYNKGTVQNLYAQKADDFLSLSACQWIEDRFLRSNCRGIYTKLRCPFCSDLFERLSQYGRQKNAKKAEQ